MKHNYKKKTPTSHYESHKAGDVAGVINEDGFIEIMIDGEEYLAHRLVWMYVHGKFPDGEINHINGDKTDNRIENLRFIG
jgi:hypothetical protein